VNSKVIPALFAVLLVFSSIAVTNRISFKVLTDMGEVCPLIGSARNREPLAVGEQIILLNFSSVCQRAHLSLMTGERYKVSLVRDDEVGILSDLGIISAEARSQILQLPKNSPLPTYNAVTQMIALPFKRVLSEPFFTVMLLNGDEEYAVGNINGATFTAHYDRLDLYLNNVVVGVPGLVGAFYYQKGAIKVSVRRETASRR
jgi:hypothetical protein